MSKLLNVINPYDNSVVGTVPEAEEADVRAAIQQTIQTTYADTAAAPPYAQMALDFWNAYQITNDLHAACLRAQETVAARPDALELLNRYGSRSPTYTAADLCPF